MMLSASEKYIGITTSQRKVKRKLSKNISRIRQDSWAHSNAPETFKKEKILLCERLTWQSTFCARPERDFIGWGAESRTELASQVPSW